MTLPKSADQRAFLLRSDDESLYVKGQSAWLSYPGDSSLDVEYTNAPPS